MELTKAEWQIMNILWQSFPASARQISNRLPKENKWAYTTIKTILFRLVTKGAVKEAKEGNICIYTPILVRQSARKSALKSLVNQAFDGTFLPLLHFLMEEQILSPKQKQQILQTLEDEEKNKRKET